MFEDCDSLLEIRNTSELSGNKKDYSDKKIFIMKNNSKFNTENIIEHSFMFNKLLPKLLIPNMSLWDTKNFSDISYMFSGCFSLKSILNISIWDFRNIHCLSYMFKGCTSLKSIDKYYLGNRNIDKNDNIEVMFNGIKGSM